MTPHPKAPCNRHHRATVALLIVTILSGCGGGPAWNPTLGLEDLPATPPDTGPRPALLSGGAPIGRDELWPLLAELAGLEAVREITLDRELAAELGVRSIEITDEMIEAERGLLSAAFSENEAISEELSRRILARRGLGPERLGRLLRRNAGLRALAGEGEPIDDATLGVAHAVRHGERRVTRVAVFASAGEAGDAASAIRARAGEVGITAAFAEIAAARSIDPSAPLGGLLGPISVVDPGMPAGLRESIRTVEPGVLGEIVALDRAFALVLVDRIEPGDGSSLEDHRERLRVEVSGRRQRLRMDEIADELILRADPTPIDPSLRWSWEQTGR